MAKSKTIQEMELPPRAKKALQAIDIETVHQLATRNWLDYYRLPGIGLGTIRLTARALAAEGRGPQSRRAANHA